MRKMFYIVIGVAVVITILVITGNKSVHHEITIEAPPEKVWDVLTSMDKYPEWNPVMQLLEGELKEGNQVKYRFTQDEDNVSEIGAKVVKIAPQELLNQKGGVPLILTYNHQYILEKDGNATKVTIHEDYNGVGVNFWNPEPVEKAYQRLNVALKERAEEDTD